jgi:hypothetical protein
MLLSKIVRQTVVFLTAFAAGGTSIAAPKTFDERKAEQRDKLRAERRELERAYYACVVTCAEQSGKPAVVKRVLSWPAPK